MKKKINVILSVFMVLCLFTVKSVSAETRFERDEKNPDLITTAERIIPDGKDRNEFNKWVEETKEVLESTYFQPIINIVDDNNSVKFHFGERFNSTIENLPLVDYIEYIKPGAENGTKGTYSYKITYYFAWGTTWTEKSSKGPAIMSVICTAAMYLYPGSTIYTGAYLLSKALGIAESLVNTYAQYAKVKTLYAYYYRNKMVSIYDSSASVYIPRVELGMRRTYSKTRYATGDTTSLPLEQEYCEYANYYNNYTPNPSNSHNVEYKSYYSNESWALNKAVQMAQQFSSYVDVYGIASNPDTTYYGTTN